MQALIMLALLAAPFVLLGALVAALIVRIGANT
jgi:hypothetical protein